MSTALKDRGNDSNVSHHTRGTPPTNIAIMYQNKHNNGKVGLSILCPITNQIKGYPFEVRIPLGLSVEGVILADQVKNLDWNIRDAELICQLSRSTITKVLKKISLLFQALQPADLLH